METYINDYKKEDDEMMLDNYEIRHELWNEIKDLCADDINKRSQAILAKWNKEIQQSIKKARNAI